MGERMSYYYFIFRRLYYQVKEPRHSETISDENCCDTSIVACVKTVNQNQQPHGLSVQNNHIANKNGVFSDDLGLRIPAVSGNVLANKLYAYRGTRQTQGMALGGGRSHHIMPGRIMHCRCPQDHIPSHSYNAGHGHNP